MTRRWSGRRTGRSQSLHDKLEFDGIPFMVIGRQMYECSFGEPRKCSYTAKEVGFPFYTFNRVPVVFFSFWPHNIVSAAYAVSESVRPFVSVSVTLVSRT